MRKLMTPSSDIKAKSSSTVRASGNGTPFRESTRTGRTSSFRKNFSELRQKNFPSGLTCSWLVSGAEAQALVALGHSR